MLSTALAGVGAARRGAIRRERGVWEAEQDTSTPSPRLIPARLDPARPGSAGLTRINTCYCRLAFSIPPRVPFGIEDINKRVRPRSGRGQVRQSCPFQRFVFTSVRSTHVIALQTSGMAVGRGVEATSRGCDTVSNPKRIVGKQASRATRPTPVSSPCHLGSRRGRGSSG